MIDSSTKSPTTKDIPTRVQLCSGEAVSLSEAALSLARLDDLAHGDSAAREELFYLRQIALGQFVPKEVRERMIKEGSLDKTCNLDSATSTVIRAAVRGTGRALTVDTNPFVDDWSRRLVELALCQERMRSELSSELAEKILHQVPYIQADLSSSSSSRSSRDSRLYNWSDRVKANRKAFDNLSKFDQ